MRITGGAFRSREIRAPRGQGTRPTSDRVREALFSILASRGAVAGARVLDVFAGTGALGLEALSRGAREAVFVEHAREALAVLRANVAALAAPGTSDVVASRAERCATALRGPFDLVFCDPPYALVHDGSVTPLLEGLAAAGLLSPAALVVLEHASRDPAPALAGFDVPEARVYGDTALALYTLSAPKDAFGAPTGV